MKLALKIVPVLVAVVLFATPAFAQYGSLHGRVIDREGNPVVGAVVLIDHLATRERLEAKTNRNGSYSISGAYQGQYKLTVVIDNRPVMVRGEAVGDAIYVGSGLDVAVNFDLKDAPATPPPAPAAASTGDAEADRAAAEAARKAAEETKNAFNARLAAMNAKNFEEAIKNFQLAAEKDPKQHVIFAQLGMAYLNTQKYDESSAAFQKAVELKPDEVPYYINMSLAYANANKLEEATQAVQKVAELSPPAAGSAYYNMGAVLTNKGNYAGAAEAFKKAIEADPNHADSHYQLAIAYFGSEATIPQAVPMLEKYLQLAPTGQYAETAKQLIEAAKAQVQTEYKSERALEAEKTQKQKGR